MEFISEQSIFSREAREIREDKMGSLFLWSIVIVVLIGLNGFSWIFCMYVFGNPEVPFCYQLLTKLEKLDPITGFQPHTSPRGKFNSTKSLYLEYYDYNAEKLNALNGILKRFYLKNYFERDDATYLSGSFKVESARTLNPDDVFPHGVAVRMQSEEFPAAHVDLVLPVPEDSPIPEEHFRPGDIVQIEESSTCAALLHVHRMEEDNICFTAVPVVERIDNPYPLPAGGSLVVSPPERLNLDTGLWPLSDDSGLVASPVQFEENGEENPGDTEEKDGDSEKEPPGEEAEKS